MLLDESELRQQLAATADQASAPRLTIEGLIGRVRRRRAKILGLVSGAVAAVAAIAVAVPFALSGPRSTAPSHPPPPLFRLSLTVTVNGHTQVFPKSGPPPTFTVTPGEHLRIRIGLGIPAHAKVTTLWLGITKIYSPSRRNGQPPSGMHPILAHTRKPLASGLHTFRLTWNTPAKLPPGTTLFLGAAWTTPQDNASVAQPVAELVTPR